MIPLATIRRLRAVLREAGGGSMLIYDPDAYAKPCGRRAL